MSAEFHWAASAAGARCAHADGGFRFSHTNFKCSPSHMGGNTDNTEPLQLHSLLYSRSLSDQPCDQHHINVCILHSLCAHPLEFLLNIPSSVAARLYQKLLGKFAAFKSIKITFESEANAIPVISATLGIRSQALKHSMAPRDHWSAWKASRLSADRNYCLEEEYI